MVLVRLTHALSEEGSFKAYNAFSTYITTIYTEIGQTLVR